jgi:hypothetical protein
MEEINMNITKGDKVRVIKVDNAVANFFDWNIGDEYIVERIDEERGVCLVSYDEKKRLTFSTNVLDYYFEKVEDEVFYEIDDEDFDYIAEILSKSEFNVTTVFGKCTIVACKLPNGFVIVESSSCVDPDDYNVDIGVENCMNRIKNKVIELEAYVRQDIESACRCDDDCCDGCHCEDCICADCCD